MVEPTTVRGLFIILSAALYYAEASRRTPPTPVNARVGEDVRMECPTDQTATFVNWYKDGQPVTQNGEIRTRETYIRIMTVRLEDRGLYSCEGIGGFGVQPRQNFTLRVYGEDVSVFPEHPVLEPVTDRPIVAPRFMDAPPGPRDQQHNVGSSPRLRCRVESYPHAKIDWFKNGRQIDYVRADVNKDGYALKFRNLQTSDQGQYMCRVDNGYGVLEFTYNLIVIDPDVAMAEVIPPYPLNTSVTFGSSASLQCKVRSNSRPTIVWLKLETVEQEGVQNTLVMQNKVYTVIKNETMRVETEEGAYLNRLVIPNVKMEDAGVYVCLGLNRRGGSDVREALLTVIRPPVMTTTTLFPETFDNSSWEYIFGSPSATLAVLIAIPVVLILLVTIAILCTIKKKKKNTSIRRPPNNMASDHEVSVPLNMNANNGCYSGQYGGGSTSSYNKVPLSTGDPRYGDKLYSASHRSQTPQQYSQYLQSDSSYRSSLQYPPVAYHHHQQHYVTDIPDNDSHFSSVSHTRPQYMSSSRNPYDDRDIHSDPAASRVGGHHCPPPPPSSYYSGQW